MIEALKRKKTLLLIIYILLGLAVVLMVRMFWLLPRKSWSLKDSRRTMLTTKDAQPTGLPPKCIRHIVLISIDTCRADHLGCYGYSRKTSPNIDAVAAEAVIFNHAITPVPITLPSHSSMLTGTIPPYHRVRDNNNYRLGSSNITLAEILRENGFITGAVIGAFVLDSQFGLDQGFDTYNDNLKKENKKFLFFNERKGEQVTHYANMWLEKHRHDKFFLFLHYFDPHVPYNLHKDFPFDSFYFLSLPRDRYDSEIAYTDHCIGRVIKKLKELNLYDSTLLIITADHGEALGEHSEDTHGYFVYHSTLLVPLIIKVPQGPKAEIINDVVSLIDIVPTVCSSLGIPVPSHVHGKDLNAFFSNKSDSVNERYIYCESLMPTKFNAGPSLGLVSNRWKYIHATEPELYDLRQDHHEIKNLFNQQLQQAHIMKDQLKLVLQNNALNRIVDSKVAINEETRKRLHSLGYISSRMVDENIQLDQISLNTKEFVELYNFSQNFLTLASTKKTDKAKKLCYRMLAKWPDMKQIHYYLGLIAVAQNNMQEVITHFSRYLAHADSDPNGSDMQIKPDRELAIAHTNLGVAFYHKGQIGQAIAHYKKALSHSPYMVEVSFYLATAYFKQDRLTNAAKYYTRTLELDPDWPEPYYRLGNALLKQGKFEQAIVHYNKALTLKPDWREARESIQLAQNYQSQTEKTIASWNESLRKNPNQPQIQSSLATMHYQRGNFEKAVYHWKMALKLQPDWPGVLNNLAWALATHAEKSLRNPEQAIELAQRCCELTDFNNPGFLCTLSTAYAADGRFKEAVEYAQKAIDLAKSVNQLQLADEIKDYLELYKQHQPYYDLTQSQEDHKP